MNQSTPPRHTNRLSRESSPYLLQHAHNPVDWHAWGPEAFEAARQQNKPIFLSVGYSTCYWCHVMERQCFEDETIAAEMNQRFINVKVDREERPDVDQLYMTAVQVLTRHGGWPMSVFLTPDLRPFYGGTYFPPTDMHGRPGFVTILRAIEDAYRNRLADVHKTADQLVNILRQYATPPAPQSPIVVDEAFIDELIRRSFSDYDPQFGGFGSAPKFPRETLLELLLVYLQRPAGNLKAEVSGMIRHTLNALADGGIRDHLGGGFHRYSTDQRWLVPHFEIMLYDNAMLGWCYVEAFRQTGESRYADVAKGIFDFVLREMTSPTGGFYTAMDAEVDGQEGLNYLWTAGEIESVLGAKDALLFNSVYGVDRGPNFADPHHGSGVADKNILFLPIPLAEAADKLKLTAAELESRLAPMRQKLYQVRLQRKQPILDTKVITSWNALIIRALAFGGKVLAEGRYVAAAEKAGEFILNSHRTPDGGLFRTSRDGVAKYHGFLDDYAFLAQALLALDDAKAFAPSPGTPREGWGEGPLRDEEKTPHPSPLPEYRESEQESTAWKDRAVALVDVMSRKFSDAEQGGFYFTENNAPDLIIRQMTASDSPLPSGNAVAAMVAMQLLPMAASRRLLATFAQQVHAQGEGMSSMVQATLLHYRQDGSFTAATQAEAAVEGRPLTPAQVAEKVVATEARWHSPSELAVHVTIAPGFHINAHQVPADLSLIATRISSTEEPTAEVDYPAGKELKVGGFEKPIRVYGGEIEIRMRFSSPREPASISLTLTYQACDDTSCLPPVKREILVESNG